MTTKTLSTYAAGGYVLAPAYTELDITKTGGVGGNGLYCGHSATISNFGTIRSTTTIGVAIGILFGPTAGGVVTNHAGGYIGGYDAVFSDTTLSLVNYGTIEGYHTAVEANSGARCATAATSTRTRPSAARTSCSARPPPARSPTMGPSPPTSS